MPKTQSGPFFPQSGNFLPSCTPVSVAEYAPISLNMPEYPWKWLNELFWLCQGSEYACSSYMFGRLLESPPVLKAAFSEHGMVVYARVTQSSEYVWLWLHNQWRLNMSQYALMSLNMPEHDRIFLNVPECMNIPEYAWLNWINCSDYMPGF